MPQFPLTDLLQINTEDEMSWYVYTLHSAWNPGGIQWKAAFISWTVLIPSWIYSAENVPFHQPQDICLQLRKE